MKKLIIAALLLVELAGCTNLQNEDGTTKHVATYGGGGAVAGAALGALLGKGMGRGKGALIGATVGGGAGALYGNHVDSQEAELRKRMTGTGVKVERDGDQLKLIMPGSITFATGKSDIQPSFYQVLGQLCASFSSFKDNDLVVTGYTDSVGGYQANEALSSRRADSVGQYLLANGVQPARVQTIGAGSSSPVASNTTEDGRAQNRRVEIKLVPHAS